MPVEIEGAPDDRAAADPRDPPYRILPAIARAVLIAVGILPWVLPFGRAYLPLGAAGEVLDRLFWPMCHRFPERTIELAGWLMPLCSRCAGIFGGIAVGAAVAWPRISLRAWRLILILASAIMVAEVITQDLGLHPVFHPTRIGTGVLLGYAMAAAFTTSVLLRSSAPRAIKPAGS
ncbi:MAG TPA: DUF2085 domain-containing protein [Polyangiaceae bacterium]|jgi:uncharacterized membrane protein|nr:DUF2085 domain-containing protein [Polyangiaceae bacterium]